VLGGGLVLGGAVYSGGAGTFGGDVNVSGTSSFAGIVSILSADPADIASLGALRVVGGIVAGARSRSNTFTSQILIGTGVRGLSCNSIGDIIPTPSDISLKTNIRPIDQGLSHVLGLNPVKFEWKETDKFGTSTEIGFIAQEVRLLIPEAVSVTAEGTLSLDYSKLVTPLTKAIQELKAIVDAQEERIKQLEAKIH
jgi:hypothetical protein